MPLDEAPLLRLAAPKRGLVMWKLALAVVAPVALVVVVGCNDQNQNPKPPPAPTTPVPTATAPTTATGAPATGAPIGNTNPAGPNTPPPTATGAATAGTAAPPGGAKQDPAVEAEQIFTQRCSVCHGMNGKGDGPGAAALNPKPRNYTDPKWQASVTDDHIAKTIVEGGAAVGKSPLMVPNADLKDKPEVVKALVAKVRSFKGK